MTEASRSVVVHGHYYQPPREDPWVEEVEREASAAPYHDWNQRIDRECYRAVVAARRYAPDGRIGAVVNTLISTSFDVGPTLLEWLERQAPRTYAAILDADRQSLAKYGGHGSAIAMPFHHAILPLASRRDKVTEVRWGITDFRRRFGRDPEGMWLPETAVDPETLDVVAAEGIRFTILAPHQITGAPAGGFPGWYRTPSGRAIALCTYDGPIANAVAFGGLLRDAAQWADRLLAPGHEGTPRALTAVATDGETYGHHQRFGEVALAWLIGDLEARGVRVENYASFLAAHPPEREVRLVSPTSWSCPHGVERWRSDCGCRLAPERPTQQRWRAPLRQGFDWLAGELHQAFEGEAADLLRDPWGARERYGEVVATDGERIAAWLTPELKRPDDERSRVRAAELLELERNALRMFTSCGWFFDDIAGIEAVQVLRYAARAIELAGPRSSALEAGLLDWLAQAPSNDPKAGSGRDLYLQVVKPRHPAAVRVAAGYAAQRALGGGSPQVSAGFRVLEDGSRLTVTHGRTGRRSALETTVERASAVQFSIAVREAGVAHAPPTTLAREDLPERERESLATAIRVDLLGRYFTADERRALATGAMDVHRASARALRRAVEDLRTDPSPGAVRAAADLADLLALLGQHIPFDAQTEYYRLHETAPPAVASQLEPLGYRLGFTGGTD